MLTNKIELNWILKSPCYLQVSIKFQQKYQIVQILPTEVSLNIKIAQIINAGRSLDASSKSFDEGKKSFSFSIRQNVIKTHHNHIRNISPCYVPDLRSSRQSWLHWGLIWSDQTKRCSHVHRCNHARMGYREIIGFVSLQYLVNFFTVFKQEPISDGLLV